MQYTCTCGYTDFSVQELNASGKSYSVIVCNNCKKILTCTDNNTLNAINQRLERLEKRFRVPQSPKSSAEQMRDGIDAVEKAIASKSL